MSELYDEEHMHASAEFKELSKETMEAYLKFQKEVFKDGALDGKTKELIGLAVGAALQCAYCIDTHAKKAKAKGATKAEMAETLHIAAAVRAGATMSYGIQTFKSVKE